MERLHKRPRTGNRCRERRQVWFTREPFQPASGATDRVLRRVRSRLRLGVDCEADVPAIFLHVCDRVVRALPFSHIEHVVGLRRLDSGNGEVELADGTERDRRLTAPFRSTKSGRSERLTALIGDSQRGAPPSAEMSPIPVLRQSPFGPFGSGAVPHAGLSGRSGVPAGTPACVSVVCTRSLPVRVCGPPAELLPPPHAASRLAAINNANAFRARPAALYTPTCLRNHGLF